ncbi:MAG: hypothetical protein AAF830_14070, partial [Pseudomonadota bacterium]
MSPGAEDRIRQDTTVLASDAMEGRRTGTAGFDKAAAFVTDRLESVGIDPAVKGSYDQPVPLQKFRRDWGSARLSLSDGEQKTSFEPLTDIFIGTSPNQAECDFEGEGVFIGYCL